MLDRKILILEPFREKHIDMIKATANEVYDVEFASYDDGEKLKELIKKAEIIVGQPPIEMLQTPDVDCPKLKLIQMTWAGTDVYTRSKLPFPKEQVLLANASGSFGMIMSQFVVCMTLSLMLGFKDYHKQQQDKIWLRLGEEKSLDGANVIVYGAGDIGGAIAKRLSGFDAHIVGVCRDKTKKREYFDELCTLDEAENYLPQMDVVVGCIPNSEQTAGYMNKQRLLSIKEGAVLVNVGRGNFVDCMALNEVLDSGHLWGAALDVTFPEPLPQDHPLWENPRCIITPHTSGTTFGQLEKTEDLLCDIVCDNIRNIIDGKEIRNRVCFEA